MEQLPEIKPPVYTNPDPGWRPYTRDETTLARKWVVPGTPELQHRIGGLEKDECTGCVSHHPQNHEVMVGIRNEKVERVAIFIPEQKYRGKDAKKLLVVGWGGQFGILFGAVNELRNEGKDIAFTHFNYIHPLPRNTAAIFEKFEKIVVCELNAGQFAKYLRAVMPQFTYEQFNKVQGQPFKIAELKDRFNELLQE